jgi:hypothetical protein
MTRQGRWKEVSRLYHAAIERSADDRQAFLEQACAGDDALRGEIESLLGAVLLRGGGPPPRPPATSWSYPRPE